MFKIIQSKSRYFIDDFEVHVGDYLCIDGNDKRIIRLSDMPRNYKGGNPRLLVYKPGIHENWRTHERVTVWVEAREKSDITRNVWCHYYNHYVKYGHGMYDGLIDIAKNSDVIRRSKSHVRVAKVQDSFKGMRSMCYGEQCISKTFTGRKNLSYNAELA